MRAWPLGGAQEPFSEPPDLWMCLGSDAMCCSHIQMRPLPGSVFQSPCTLLGIQTVWPLLFLDPISTFQPPGLLARSAKPLLISFLPPFWKLLGLFLPPLGLLYFHQNRGKCWCFLFIGHTVGPFSLKFGVFFFFNFREIILPGLLESVQTTKLC